MKRDLPLLNSVSVAKPCSANWNEMSGDDKKRFCGHCQKHVHNLSAMSGKEAENLLGNSPNLCVRYSTDSNRKPMTRWQLRRKNARSWLGALLAVLVSGPYGCEESPGDVMGDMATTGKVAVQPPVDPKKSPPTTPSGQDPKVKVIPGGNPEVIMGAVAVDPPQVEMGEIASNEIMGRRAPSKDRPEPK